MSDEVKPEVIKKTQDLLGKYFKKPPLSDKLLRKPPFRFIQDIVAAVIKETGFLEGLFANEELSANISKDKEAKLEFLTKLIDVVKLITGLNLTVRATKIIAGHEPTKTNELLQAIGKALDKNINSKEAILHYKNRGEKNSDIKNSVKKSQPVKKLITATSTQSVKSVKKDQRDSETERKKIKKPKSQEHDIKEKLNERKVTKSKEKSKFSQQKISKTVEQHLNENFPQKLLDVAVSREPSAKIQESRDVKDAAVNQVPKPQSARLNSVVSKNGDRESEINKDLPLKRTVNSETVKSDNPETIKWMKTNSAETIKRADFGNYTEPQKKNDEHKIIQNSISRESTFSAKGRGSDWIDAGGNAISVSNIIVENQEKNEETGNDMVVVETNKDNLFKSYQNDESNVTEDRGYLVAQILKTEQELVNTNTADPVNKKVEIVWQTGVLKDQESAVKAVDNLRNLIQTLIKYTNPLGKILDYLQGDVEIMQKELMDYKKQYAAVNELLEEERSQTEKFMNHMEESLNDIQTHVLGKENKIHQIKINISKNELQIQRLLNDSA